MRAESLNDGFSFFLLCKLENAANYILKHERVMPVLHLEIRGGIGVKFTYI